MVINLQIEIRIKEETKKHITFYLYVNRYQTRMTLAQQDFAGFCSLLTGGQIGVSLDKVNAKGTLVWINAEKYNEKSK